MEIQSLQSHHLDEAASMFADRYRVERRSIPELPIRHEAPEAVRQLLEDLAARAPGVVALAEGRAVGYLIGLPIPSFFGNQKGVFSPIWASSAVGGNRAGVYREMYASLAARWVGAGYLNHAICLYSRDVELADVLFRNCFGLQVIDAIRDLEPIAAEPVPGIEIRLASAADAGAVVQLGQDLYRYISTSPIFFPLFGLQQVDQWSSWIATEGNRLWLAFADGRAVGYIRTQPPQFDVAYVVQDPGTISITGAFVDPDWRRQGVARLVLSRVVEWARETGYERISVDFESANSLGSRFWHEHFHPICHSLLRKVDERILWGRPDLPATDLW